MAFFSRIVVFLGPAPGAKRWSGNKFSPFLQNFESRSGKKRNAFWPVGFLTIFVVRERPQGSSVRGLPRESQLCKAVGSRERKGYSEKKKISGIRIAEICSVKIARPQTAFSKIREIVAKVRWGTVWDLGVG